MARPECLFVGKDAQRTCIRRHAEMLMASGTAVEDLEAISEHAECKCQEEAGAPDDRSPKHPEIHVRLVGEDGNAFMLLGLVLRLSVAGWPQRRLAWARCDLGS